MLKTIGELTINDVHKMCDFLDCSECPIHEECRILFGRNVPGLWERADLNKRIQMEGAQDGENR